MGPTACVQQPRLVGKDQHYEKPGSVRGRVRYQAFTRFDR
jgi:hypothetical protein